VLKRLTIIGLAILILVAGWFLYQQVQNNRAAAMGDYQIEGAQRAEISATFEADGVLRSNQTAELNWQTPGTVEHIDIEVGKLVSKGQVLASLEDSSLPQNILLAQADLINAQRALDDLYESQTQRAEALKAVELAEQSLEDALNPELAQANALSAVSQAQKDLEEAKRNYLIVSRSASNEAIEQAHANMLMAKRVYDETQRQYDKIENKYNRNPNMYKFWESKKLYKRILESLEQKLLRDRLAYERSQERYDNLLEPPDPGDVALAEAAVALGKALLTQAEQDLESIQDGPRAVDIAVLEARLEDTRREWEQIKNGPDQNDIIAAEARITAAEATLKAGAITAPFSGTITDINNKPGDIVNAGELAFRLDDQSHMMVNAQVSEIDINKIQPGQETHMTFDSVRDKEYHGLVVEVPLYGTETDGVASFNTVIELIDGDGNIRPGMSGMVTFVTDSVGDALVVPTQALRFEGGQRVVYILKDGDLIPVEVTLGISNSRYAQVTASALAVGDLIVLNPPGN
jgi:HlyD family secretion protein